jgi:hypothetical protein
LRKILAASAIVAGLLVCAPVALASPPTRAHLAQYRHEYWRARRAFGAVAVGCNLAGRVGRCHFRTTDQNLTDSLGVLSRMWAPPPAETAPVRASTVASAPPYTPRVATVNGSFAADGSSGGCGGITPYSGGGQCWAIPYGIVQCESGGQNVPNSQSSGAQGYYQLMSGGTGTRSEQDAAAARLWAGGAGGSNWSQCGG